MDNQKALKRQEKLDALRLRANDIIRYIEKVRDYRVDYYGRLKDGTEIIIPKQYERPSRGETVQESWDFHVEDGVLTAIGYYDLLYECPVERAFAEIPW